MNGAGNGKQGQQQRHQASQLEMEGIFHEFQNFELIMSKMTEKVFVNPSFNQGQRVN